MQKDLSPHLWREDKNNNKMKTGMDIIIKAKNEEFV